MQHLLAVDGDVGRDDAEREGEGRDAEALAPALEQDETVERNLALLADRLPLAAFDRRVDGQPREGDDQREGEEQVEVVHRVVEVEARRGSYRHGDVVAQPVVSDPFGAARGVEHVDGHRAAGHGRGAERRAVHRAHHGEEEQRAGDVVAREEQREAEVADQQHLLAGETVDDKPAEGPHGKGREGVAAEDESDHRLVGRKGVAQEERQQRREQIEREKKHEVGDPHLQVVAVPQCRPRRAVPVFLLRHHRRMFLVSADRFSRFAALPLSLFPSSLLSLFPGGGPCGGCLRPVRSIHAAKIAIFPSRCSPAGRFSASGARADAFRSCRRRCARSFVRPAAGLLFRKGCFRRENSCQIRTFFGARRCNSEK